MSRKKKRHEDGARAPHNTLLPGAASCLCHTLVLLIRCHDPLIAAHRTSIIKMLVVLVHNFVGWEFFYILDQLHWSYARRKLRFFCSHKKMHKKCQLQVRPKLQVLMECASWVNSGSCAFYLTQLRCCLVLQLFRTLIPSNMSPKTLLQVWTVRVSGGVKVRGSVGDRRRSDGDRLFLSNFGRKKRSRYSGRSLAKKTRFRSISIFDLDLDARNIQSIVMSMNSYQGMIMNVRFNAVFDARYHANLVCRLVRS